MERYITTYRDFSYGYQYRELIHNITTTNQCKMNKRQRKKCLTKATWAIRNLGKILFKNENKFYKEISKRLVPIPEAKPFCIPMQIQPGKK